jgi:hypothetical protein
LTHPKDVPLDEWRDGWLTMTVASYLDLPGYVMMYDIEKKRAGYPVSRQEKIDFIKKHMDQK